MRALRRRISWAPRRESLHPYNSHLTVYTTLKFYSQLKYPQRGKSDMTDRVINLARLQLYNLYFEIILLCATP